MNTVVGTVLDNPASGKVETGFGGGLESDVVGGGALAVPTGPCGFVVFSE